MTKPLAEFINYRNLEALSRFEFQYKIAGAEAELIFEDVLNYLWLTATLDDRRQKDPETPDITIWNGMVVLDEMWHCFILVTEQYTDFCNKNFGRYIHHPPPLFKFFVNEKNLGTERSEEILVEELIPLVYEELGEEVAIRWFDTYTKYAEIRNMH